MNFEPSDDQLMIAKTFARFLDEHSSMARVRAACATGFDAALWQGLADLGAIGMRVPEDAGGIGLGLFDAALLMEEAGRTLASGPLAEAIVATRLLATLGGVEHADLLARAVSGVSVVTIALRDAADAPRQIVGGGSVATAVLVREGNDVMLVTPETAEQQFEDNLAATSIAELTVGSGKRTVIASGPRAIAEFEAALEEWKVLTAASLSGLSRQALKLAAAYASERKAFGQFISTYQGIAHPLADLIVDTDGGKFAVWRAIHDIAHCLPGAAAKVSMALWWNTRTADQAVARSLHTFGGYGLSVEYDIHLYNLRARALPLVMGDTERLIEEAGRRLYLGEAPPLPDAGALSIDFELGEEADALAAEVDAFFKRVLTPELKAKAHYSYAGHDAGVHKKLADAGLLFPAWPREYGGREAKPYAIHAASAVWEANDWSGHAAGTSNMVGWIMQRFGSDELKAEALSRVANGEAVCSLGFSEPGSGSDVFAAVTRATPDGNGWRIDGQKMFTSGADIADYVLMLARTDSEGPKHKGLTMFIVPLKSEGVTIQPVHTFQGEKTNITFYDNVRIPDSYRLGEVGGGTRVMIASLELEQSAGFIKTQQHMLAEAERFCRDTVRSGHPLIEDPVVATRLAKVATHNFVCEGISNRALWVAAEKRENLAYGPMVKMFSSEKFQSDSSDLLSLMAPESLFKRNGSAGFINQCYRHAQGTTVYGGTSEVHRSMIAERALGMPRSRG